MRMRIKMQPQCIQLKRVTKFPCAASCCGTVFFSCYGVNEGRCCKKCRESSTIHKPWICCEDSSPKVADSSSIVSHSSPGLQPHRGTTTLFDKEIAYLGRVSSMECRCVDCRGALRCVDFVYLKMTYVELFVQAKSSQSGLSPTRTDHLQALLCISKNNLKSRKLRTRRSWNIYCLL